MTDPRATPSVSPNPDILGVLRDVRFTPESGHQQSALGCPLCANSGEAPRPDVRFTPESGHWLSGLRCPLCAKSRNYAVQHKATYSIS
jgi:hypothetical protein